MCKVIAIGCKRQMLPVDALCRQPGSTRMALLQGTALHTMAQRLGMKMLQGFPEEHSSWCSSSSQLWVQPPLKSRQTG